MKQTKKIFSNNGKQMLSARAAAARLCCAPDYIGKLCRDGKLSGTQVNGAWFVYEPSLDSFEFLREEARAARSEELSTLRRQELYNNGFVSKKEIPAGISLLNLNPLITKMALASAAIGFVFIASVSLAVALRTAPGGPLGAALGELQSPFFAQKSLSFSLPSIAVFGQLFNALFASRVSVETKTKPVIRPAQQEPFPAAPTTAPAAVATADGILQAALATSSKVQYAIYPVIERTIEKERVIVENGISPELLTSIVKELAAGSDGSIQYNSSGSFSASSTALVWDNEQGALKVQGALSADSLCLRGVCLTKTQLQSLLSTTTATSTP